MPRAGSPFLPYKLSRLSSASACALVPINGSRIGFSPGMTSSIVHLAPKDVSSHLTI